MLGSKKDCHGLTPVGSSAPHIHALTFPQWDGGDNQKGKSEKTFALRQRQFSM